MKTVKGNPDTHYISRGEWDISYMVNEPIIDKFKEGDIVIITDGSSQTTNEVILQKMLKRI